MDYIHKDFENPKKIKVINTEDIYSTGLKMLLDNNFDSLLVNRSSADFYLKRMKLIGSYKQVGCLEKEKIYIAFSPKYPNKSKYLSSVFDKNIIKLKKSKYIEKLLDKYGIISNNF